MDISLEIIKTVFILIIGKYILMQKNRNDSDNNNLCVILYIKLMKIMTFSKLVFETALVFLYFRILPYQGFVI